MKQIGGSKKYRNTFQKSGAAVHDLGAISFCFGATSPEFRAVFHVPGRFLVFCGFEGTFPHMVRKSFFISRSIGLFEFMRRSGADMRRFQILCAIPNRLCAVFQFYAPFPFSVNKSAIILKKEELFPCRWAEKFHRILQHESKVALDKIPAYRQN